MLILQKAKAYLKAAGIETPGLDAEVLLADLLGVERYELYTKDFKVDEKAYFDLLKKRAEGIPVAYLTGEKEFFENTFYVGPGVLIPRPDSESIVEAALEVLKGKPAEILDLCAGSGCLGLSVALKTKSSLTLVDDDPVALKYLKRNRDRLYPEAKIIQSDLFDKVEDHFDLIISNPPYIDFKTYETLSREVKNEPEHALLAGDGLDFYRKILAEVLAYLKTDGVLLFEVGGKKQAKEVIRLAEFYGKGKLKLVRRIEDLGGHVRGLQFKLG